jgi:putative DNA-invertase from lambdoid prophage Rac
MSVYGYCRVSTGRQATEGQSLEVQERQVRAWADLHGWTLDTMVIERGVSGSIHVAERPEGSKLMASLRKGDVLIASKLDRLFRSALDALQTVEDFKARGISLVLIDLSGDVTGNGLGKLFLTVSAAFAEAERDKIRERVQSVKTDQKARNRYLGGIMMWGYRKAADGSLEAIPEQQAAIERMRKMRASGASLRAIAGAMQADGHQLSHEAVRAILARPVEQKAA